MRRALTALTLSALLPAAWAGGVVEVSFKPVAELSDAGNDRIDAERNLQTLGAHFKSLAARLPDGQVLQVEVTDLDLAGQSLPTRRGGDLRVLRGRADWPSMSLRWTLRAGDRTLASGEERLSDMNYLMHPPRGQDDGPLPYETRLVDRWFAERVLAAGAK